MKLQNARCLAATAINRLLANDSDATGSVVRLRNIPRSDGSSSNRELVGP